MGERFPRQERPSGAVLLDWVIEVAPELLPAHNDEYPGRNVVVIGSFKGWHTIVKPYRERLRRAGFFPLAPRGEEITHYAGTFEVLDSDAQTLATMESRLGRQLSDPERAMLLEALFCTAIQKSDLVYVAGLPKPDIEDGDYIGLQVAYELGLAMANGPVFGTEISPTLDDRDGYDGWASHFAAHVAMVAAVTPEELGARYATMSI